MNIYIYIQHLIHKEQTYTTHSFTFKNAISDAQTLEMILEKACPCLWDKKKVCKGTKQMLNYIQPCRDTAYVSEQSIIQKAGKIHYPFSI